MLPNSPGRTNEDFSTLKPKTNFPVTDREVTYGQDERTISTTDLKGIITSVNDVFVRISGFNREDLIDSSHNIIRHLATLRKIATQFADNDLMEFDYSGRGQETSTVEHFLLMQQSKLNSVVGQLQ
ncbi:MAG: PAS domain S-box protein [Candidatus Thiodiazotropha lotti]|uniref:PAS domain S-box protein n=1 Tax=Candidatus Thiodiazotropha lotti TaxID=2792787 RepID=A0A9E4K5Y1_9GAMM|nr:PAS domain S-box protein [Candidatus Thiodiazotropha lotti]MCG7988383.1 PAS domain S-box protein [Candidatus Thiodiazotropha lotti]MCG8013874.1 PAS domain S-box protein [Candidatus Thiodiazotropha lotti]MCG8021551.1 PAS domain S-box protein [Candidatus Thiodiazotropha lotti]MCW4204656.1 PAS domain S-box protein [Candidatus Thiodiazotropha lotti]